MIALTLGQMVNEQTAQMVHEHHHWHGVLLDPETVREIARDARQAAERLSLNVPVAMAHAAQVTLGALDICFSFTPAKRCAWCGKERLYPATRCIACGATELAAPVAAGGEYVCPCAV